jgi:glutathione S-transferase
MRLFYTPASPYARIVRIIILELGLNARVQLEIVSLCDRHSELLKYNPIGKVPTLETDDQFILVETELICRYLNQLNPDIALFPEPNDLFAQHLYGMTTSFLEGVCTWAREYLRPCHEQSLAIIDLEQLRASRCLDYFEKIAHKLGQNFSLTHVILAVALSMEKQTNWLWQPNYPQLAIWYQQFCQRPSMRI